VKGNLWLLRLSAGALTPFILLSGLLGAGLSLFVRAPVGAFAGLLGAVLTGRDLYEVTAGHPGFEQAFEKSAATHADRATGSHPRRGARRPSTGAAQWQKNMTYWTLPGSGRELLCDLWRPPAGTPSSGLGVIYLHGSAWCMLDKDFATRSFFRHLASQGHTVMDVAYRMYPETDMPGMVADVKRAIAWMKSHGPDIGVSPDRVVLAGASAGGHLALLAAYTPNDEELRPADAGDADLGVRGVMSCYGPADMRFHYEHLRERTWVQPGQGVELRPPGRLARRLFGPSYERLRLGSTGAVGAISPILGGPPESQPAKYALFSPTTHVRTTSPPTLLIQGRHDVIASMAATNLLYDRLVAAGVPAANIVLPHAEHGFDLTLPGISPSARAAWRYQDRFLALMQ
jgi:acetyl esterase/lipase